MKSPGRTANAAARSWGCGGSVEHPGGHGCSVEHPGGCGCSVEHLRGCRSSVEHPGGCGSSVERPWGCGCSVEHPVGDRGSMEHPGGHGGSTEHLRGCRSSTEHPRGCGGSMEHPGATGTSAALVPKATASTPRAPPATARRLLLCHSKTCKRTVRSCRGRLWPPRRPPGSGADPLPARRTRHMAWGCLITFNCVFFPLKQSEYNGWEI